MTETHNVPLISEFMKTLRDEYGFDTIAVRRMLVESICASDNQRRHLLDVGTGSGWMALVAAQYGYEVVSVDRDRYGLVRARQRVRQTLEKEANQIHFIQGDALQMPFRDDWFDAVLSFDVVHHLADRRCPRAIMEMARVCKPEGNLVIADLNEHGKEAVDSVHARAGLTHEENRCGVRQLEDMLNALGLEVVRRDTTFVSLFHVLENSSEPGKA